MIRIKGKNKKFTIFIIFILIFLCIILWRNLSPFKEKIPPSPLPEKVEKKTKPEIKEELPYKIAIIIDDVGYPNGNIRAYTEFRGKLTFSILPFLSHSKEYQEILKHNGFEIMLHLPMEPLSYPNTDPGPFAIMINDSRQEVEQKLSNMLKQIHYAAGVNNHMGSRITQDKIIMEWILSYLKPKDLFFIDSLTSPFSCTYEIAQKLDVKTSKRDIFLDNEDSFDYINHQFEKLKEIAKEKGSAIGIAHFNKIHTIEVLNYKLFDLKSEGFDLVFASELAGKKTGKEK